MSIESQRHPHDGSIAQHADLLATVVPFSGSTLTLNDNMNGKVMRADFAGAVTVTVPSTLSLGFNCGIAVWGTGGSLSLSAGGGMSNRTGKTALAAQYQTGSVAVLKSGEFVVGGDFA